MDILIEKPYIQKLITVVKNSMRKTPGGVVVNGRLGDAFVYILSGSCNYYFENGVEFLAEQGDVLYLANKAVYEMRLQSETYNFIYVDFLFEEKCNFDSRVFKKENDNVYLNLFEKLYNKYKILEEKVKLVCMKRLYDIYITLCDRNEKVYVPRTLKEKIASCKEFMVLHSGNKDLSIAQLAESAKMSEVYFRKAFLSIYKVSPKKYLTKMRLDKAVQWMKYTFLSLEEISSMCGFSSWQYFSRVFKNEYGETPAVYRKKKIVKK